MNWAIISFENIWALCRTIEPTKCIRFRLIIFTAHKMSRIYRGLHVKVFFFLLSIVVSVRNDLHLGVDWHIIMIEWTLWTRCFVCEGLGLYFLLTFLFLSPFLSLSNRYFYINFESPFPSFQTRQEWQFAISNVKVQRFYLTIITAISHYNGNMWEKFK